MKRSRNISIYLLPFLLLVPVDVMCRDNKHAGKAGLYLRMAKSQRINNPEYFLRHPLVDAVCVSFPWSGIEPEQGKYDFSEIDRIKALCEKYNKGMVLCFSPYGQNIKQPVTPKWLYEKGVKKITFSGGGVSKHGQVTVPRTWDSNKYMEHYGKLIKKAGARYNNEKSIWYIMPGFGHIGNINAQPSKGGAPAFLKQGWTPEKWKAFCLKVVNLYKGAFPDTPLIVKSAKQLLKNKEQWYYADEADWIILEMAKQGVSVITFGLTADIERLLNNRILQRITALSPYSLAGKIRVGISDDWPLWVPKSRQDKGPTRGRDEKGLQKELQYAFGGVDGIPETHISIIRVLHPEIDASHPEKGAEQNKEVYDLLDKARTRLKAGK